MSMQSLQWRTLWLGLGWLMVVVLVYLCLMPNPPQPIRFAFADKVEHAASFAWLAWWFLQIVATTRRWRAAAALLLLGVAIEVAQSFTVTRSAELADVAADGLGILLGAGLVHTPLGGLLAGVERWFVSRILKS